MQGEFSYFNYIAVAADNIAQWVSAEGNIVSKLFNTFGPTFRRTFKLC